MADIQDGITPELDRIIGELTRLKKMNIHVGIQGVAGTNAQGAEVTASADIMTIAGVHEFGATITAKKVKNLAIPVSKKAIGKSPKEFDGLFFMECDGLLYGCISKNRKGSQRNSGRPRVVKQKKYNPTTKPIKSGKIGDIEFLFLLMPSANIPERSFIRAGYDNNKSKLEEACMRAINGILFDAWNAETAANHVGMIAVGAIQEYMNTPSNFKPKSTVTKATSNWGDNPLVESGRLRNSITYVIEEG